MAPRRGFYRTPVTGGRGRGYPFTPTRPGPSPHGEPDGTKKLGDVFNEGGRGRAMIRSRHRTLLEKAIEVGLHCGIQSYLKHRNRRTDKISDEESLVEALELELWNSLDQDFDISDGNERDYDEGGDDED